MRGKPLPTLAMALGVGIALSSPASPLRAQGKPAKKPPVKNETKGQNQLAGAYTQFGATYSLQNNFNFTLLSARYSIEPFIAYTPLYIETESKLVVLDFALKNISKDDNFFDEASFITLVDEKGELYPNGSYALKSRNSKGLGLTLRPGQGVGQPELKDPLQVAFQVPATVRIVKIMINQGRLGKQESVLRYPIAGATKEEAGEAGDPKNIIAPLPESVRDKMEKSGAVAKPEGEAKMGEYVPSGAFALRLDSFAFSTDALKDGAPEEGKRFAIATVTAKSLTYAELTMFEIIGNDSPLHQLLDTEGERLNPAFYRKGKRDEDPEHTFKQGDEYTFRIVFLVPKDATFKKLTLGSNNARKWAYDVSGVK